MRSKVAWKSSIYDVTHKKTCTPKQKIFFSSTTRNLPCHLTLRQVHNPNRSGDIPAQSHVRLGVFFRKSPNPPGCQSVKRWLWQVFVAVKKWEFHLFSTEVAFMRAFDCERLDTTYFRLRRLGQKLRFSALPPLIEFGHYRTWLGL